MCINRCLMRNAVVRCISCLRVFIVLNAVCECDRASTDRFWYFSRFMIIAWKFIWKKKHWWRLRHHQQNSTSGNVVHCVLVWCKYKCNRRSRSNKVEHNITMQRRRIIHRHLLFFFIIFHLSASMRCKYVCLCIYSAPRPWFDRLLWLAIKIFMGCIKMMPNRTH